MASSNRFPVLRSYVKEYPNLVELSAGGFSQVIYGETFVTHESLLNALRDPSVPTKASDYAKGLVARMTQDPRALRGCDVSDLAKSILLQVLEGRIEVDGGLAVVNFTKFSLEFAVEIMQLPEYLALDSVEQARLMTGILTILCFLRDDCPFEEMTSEGLKTHYPD